MRIVCDNCAAKYQISDEKVRNKVFKIRCKRCAHVIVVRANEQGERAEAPAHAAAESVEATPAAAQAAAGAVWYVVVNREQVGPLTPDQVLAHFERGEIDADTFTWAEGMADWVRLATIPDFADHVAAAAPAPAEPEASVQVSTQQAAEPAPAAQATSASLFDDGDDDDVIASNNQSESLFGDANDDGFEGGGPRVSSSQQLRNQRNENSVLFSLDSLAADAEPARSGGVVTNTGGSDASGLIDISAIGPGGSIGMGAPGAPVAAAALDDAFGGASGGAAVFAPVAAAPAGPMPTYVTRPSGGGGKVAIYAVLALLVLGGGGFAAWHFTKDDPDADGKSPASVSNASTPSAAPATGPSKVAIGTPATAASAPAPATAPSAASLASAASAAPATEEAAAPESIATAKKTPRATKRTTRRSPTKRTPTRPKTTAEDKPPVAAAPRTAAPKRVAKPSKGSSDVDDLLNGLGGGGKPARTAKRTATPTPSAGGDPTLPDKLSKSQILRVVRTNASKISGCKNRDPGASGTIKVVMVIGKSGRVNSAKAGGPFAGTPVGSCVEGKVRSFRFPQFGGDDMRINMPFRL